MKIKKTSALLGKNINVSNNQAQYTEIKHPVFCLKYLNKAYHLDKCIDKEKVALINKICLLSQMTWKEMYMSPRHGLGLEQISQNSIKGAGIPTHLSKDETMYAIRFHGIKPMVGYIKNPVFHIVYLDRDFTLYNH